MQQTCPVAEDGRGVNRLVIAEELPADTSNIRPSDDARNRIYAVCCSRVRGAFHALEVGTAKRHRYDLRRITCWGLSSQ